MSPPTTVSRSATGSSEGNLEEQLKTNARSILREFCAERPGAPDDLAETASVSKIRQEGGKKRVCRQIAMTEKTLDVVLSRPEYEDDLPDDVVAYRDRYDVVPQTIADLRRTIDQDETGWVSEPTTRTLQFEEDEGLTPRVCGACNGNLVTTCRTCNGSTWRTCPKCGGDAEITCPNSSCSNGSETCNECNGSGNSSREGVDNCANCNGRGHLPCKKCTDGTVPCPRSDCRGGEAPCGCGNGLEPCYVCDESGEVVDAKRGTITYEATEWQQGDPGGMVPIELIPAVETERIATNRKSVDPGPSTSAIESYSRYEQTPATYVKYRYDGAAYELYKVEDEFYYQTYPHTRRAKIRVGATVAAALVAFAVLFVGVSGHV